MTYEVGTKVLIRRDMDIPIAGRVVEIVSVMSQVYQYVVDYQGTPFHITIADILFGVGDYVGVKYGKSAKVLGFIEVFGSIAINTTDEHFFLSELVLDDELKEDPGEKEPEYPKEEDSEGYWEEDDMVNSPSHYQLGNLGIEVKDVIHEIVKEYPNPEDGYDAGNALKYISRAPKKGAYIQDLKKAVTYLNYLIDRYE